MDDIVEKLREYYENWSLGSKGPAILAQAADLIESLRSDNARLAKELEEARKALETSIIALDDWLRTYAYDMCKAKSIDESLRRISDRGGTLAYIAEVQAGNRAAIRHKATVTTDDLPEGGSET